MAEEAKTTEELNTEVERLQEENERLKKDNKKLSAFVDGITGSVYNVLSKKFPVEKLLPHVEEKNGLRFLSWAVPRDIITEIYPYSEFGIIRPESGELHHKSGDYAYVEVYIDFKATPDKVLKHAWMFLPVTDNRNQSIPYEKVTTMDANAAIQRAWVKAAACEGLGLQFYSKKPIPKNILKIPQTGQGADKTVTHTPADNTAEPEKKTAPAAPAQEVSPAPAPEQAAQPAPEPADTPADDGTDNTIAFPNMMGAK